jgi:glycosidase
MNNPDWIPESIFYHIYPLGLCGAPLNNDLSLPPINRLAILMDWIPHLKSLGVNAVYLGPVFESISHGYDTTDLKTIDRRLGTNHDLTQVVETFHQQGIRVILDAVFNHVGRQFPAFLDLQQVGQRSMYRDWFYGIDFSQSSPLGDPFTYYAWEGHYNLVKLNLQNPAVCDYLVDVVRTWFNTWKIDGLRLDAIDQLDLNFLRQLRQTTFAINPQAWLMGESVHGDYKTWANPDMVHSITNYECYKGLYSSHNEQNLFEIAYGLKRQFGPEGLYKDLLLYNFVDNHDVNRLASMLRRPEYLTTVYLLLYTMPGIPSIYYGSEWGISGEEANHSDQNLRPVLHLEQMESNPPHPELVPWLRHLAEIRLAQPALKMGRYQEVYVQKGQFAFLRCLDNENILIVINIADEPVQIKLQNLPENRQWVDLLHVHEPYRGEGAGLTLELPAFSGSILKAQI